MKTALDLPVDAFLKAANIPSRDFSSTTQPVLHDAAGNTTAASPVYASSPIKWGIARQHPGGFLLCLRYQRP